MIMLRCVGWGMAWGFILGSIGIECFTSISIQYHYSMVLVFTELGILSGLLIYAGRPRMI
jgi:hypothetical protein